jgi:hypothetical protein
MATLDGWLIFAIPYLIIKKKLSLSLSIALSKSSVTD